jgi:hypothetical protein
MVGVFFRNELKRAVRTFRLQVLAGAFLLQALLDPLGSRLLPLVLASLGLTEEGASRTGPLDALQAYGSDSTRLALLVLTLVCMTAASDEFRKGSHSGAFLFTRGVDPRVLMHSKALAWMLMAGFCAFFGQVLASLVTWVVLGPIALRPLAVSIAGALLFWPLAALAVVAGSAGSRSSLGGLLVGLSLIAAGVLQLAGVLEGWLPSALLTAVKPAGGGEGGIVGLLLPGFAVTLSLAGPLYVWAWVRVSELY